MNIVYMRNLNIGCLPRKIWHFKVIFILANNLNERKSSIMEGKDEVNKWCEFHQYDFRQYKGTQSVQKMARNLVDYEAGKTILETALNIVRKSDLKQISIFDEL